MLITYQQYLTDQEFNYVKNKLLTIEVVKEMYNKASPDNNFHKQNIVIRVENAHPNDVFIIGVEYMKARLDYSNSLNDDFDSDPGDHYLDDEYLDIPY